MTIRIIHDDKTYVGRVVYNFNQISDAVLVSFDKPIYEGKRHVLFRFDETLNTWVDEEGIYKSRPVLFGQIFNKLDTELKENNRKFESKMR